MSPVLALSLICAVLGASLAYAIQQLMQLRTRLRSYGPIDDVDIEVSRRRMDAEQHQRDAHRYKREAEEALGILEELRADVAGAQDDADMVAINLYEALFDFDDPEAYRNTIKVFRESRREMVRAKTAIVQHKEWYVEGSKKEGDRFMNSIRKLALQAFHGEADALSSKISATNWERTLDRVDKTQARMNKALERFHLELTDAYVSMMKREMRATFELALRRKEIKEAEREMRAQMREEKRMQKEIEAERKRLRDEEERERRAIEQARAELAAAHGEQRDELMARLAELEAQLADTEERTRTLSMAEQTRVGHVYIVSNVGSFGRDVYKVGMTRRLDPDDRVKELSDASVPFPFDLHAMIQAKDAPSLEAELHRALDATRVNKVNYRKEFFRTSLDDILRVVEQCHGVVDYVRVPAAEEFRQTLAVLEAEARQREQGISAH